ncbi:variable surface protein [Plasmodium gonderi]|uniref:Variable surface protein n=1 Tax=Plasmodium gonderi TaxID=77519 RepID=A0A1Y1JNW2_PLAGO|nr:variable surface protein [Plasmodium gonderi]GAW83950.1 variable surface protein [Plasmodium gonderi]
MGKKNIQNKLKVYFENDELGLPSAHFYKKLDRRLFNYNNVNWKHNQNELRVYYNICEFFNKTHRSDFFRRLCSVLLWYLSTENTIINEENNDYNNCELLNYWIYSRLSWIYDRISDHITYMFGNLQLLWNSLIGTSRFSSFYNKCSPKFKMPYYNNWMERKKLYDYCIDYEKILLFAENYKDKREIFFNYFKIKTELYDKFNKICSKGKTQECPEFFNNCKKSSPSEALKKIRHYIERDKGISENSGMQNKDAISVHTSKESETSLEVQFDAIDSKSSEDDSLLRVYETEEFADLYINPDRSSIIFILGKTFLGLILFTVLSSILYKFTPMGIHLSKMFGQRKNIISDINRSKNMLFDYSSESCNQNYMNGEEHFVGYHPE